MRKYKVVILNRIDQDNLIVKAKSLDKNKNPVGEHPIIPKPTKPRGAPKWFQDFEIRNNGRFDRLEQRVGNIENRLERVENRLERVENRLERVENRLSNVEQTLDRNNIR